MPDIALTLLDAQPDVIVLCEFRLTMGGQLRALLDEHGWSAQVCSDPLPARNGMLIAAKDPDARTPPHPPRDHPAHGRLLSLHAAGITVVGIHAPDARADATWRAAYWRHLVDLARTHAPNNAVLLGDFNIARRERPGDAPPTPGAAWLGELTTLGYVDAWRSLNPDADGPTWFSHAGRGFRFDAAYVSQPLRPRLRAARHDDQPRAGGISDHAPVIVDFDP